MLCADSLRHAYIYCYLRILRRVSKSPTETVSFVLPVRLSVRSHGRTRLPLHVVSWNFILRAFVNTEWSKVSVHLTQCIRTIPTQLRIWRWPSQNTFGMWTALYWTRSSRTQFGVSLNVWRLAGDTLNITCNFLYCNHQVHRGFLITLYLRNVLLKSDKYISYSTWRPECALCCQL